MIEILGIGCRYPGNVNSPEDFWRLLQTSQSAIGEIPEGRWAPEAYLSATPATPGKSVTFRAGWLRAVDRFDAGYFRLSPREAAEMDPQQRLVLEVACEAILDANINPDRLRGCRVGVFVGAGIAEYQAMAFSAPAAMTQHTMSGNSLAVIANRLSFLLDLHGPSLTVDTACSAALTAFHLACQSFAADECDLALVAGVNTLLSPSPFIGFSQAQMLSPRGVLAPFDSSADGFVRGEGCGAVLLGRKDRPVNGVRRAYAQVLSSGVNEDGRTASMTMPATAHQAALIRQTMARAGLDPGAVDYIEAHGTGTPIGDPSEAEAIASAVAAGRAAPLPIGSAKGHVGHLETAAGIVGLTKIALCIYHRQLVPTAGHTQFPPSIDGRALGLRVPVAPEPAASPEPVMGVCSYGFGGANACAFLRSADAPASVAPPDGVDPAIALPLSAHHPEGIPALVDGFRALSSDDLSEAARWAGIALPARRHRQVLLASQPGSFFETAHVFTGEAKGEPPRVIFAFGGQGAQHLAMGHALYARLPRFRACIDRLDAIFQEIGGSSLIRGHGFCQGDMRAGDLADVRIALPCIVMIQAALVEQLAALGVHPAAVTGHSTGEMAAAWTCGALTEASLCRLTHARAQLQYRMQPGAMAAWTGTSEETAALLERLGVAGQITIAAMNAPGALTLSGDPAAIDQLIQYGKAHRIRCVRLDVSRAYHSHHVTGILEPLRAKLAFVTPGVAKIPFISSVQGHAGPVAGEALDSEYWVRNIARPVDLAGTGPSLDLAGDLVLEISPRAVLAGYLQQICARDVIVTLHQRQPEVLSLLRGAAELFVRGVDIDWREAQQAPHRFVALPRPPWRHDVAHRSAAWRPPQAAASMAAASSNLVITLTGAPYLSGHIVDSQAVMPGAGWVAHTLARTDGRRLDALEFHRFLPLWPQAQDTVLTWRQDGGQGRWADASGDLMSCRLPKTDLSTFEFELEPVEAIRARCAAILDAPRLYRFLSEHSGLDLRGAFRSLQEVYAGDAEALGRVRVADDVRDPEGILTVLLDGCFQVAGLSQTLDAHARVPVSIASLAWRPAETVRAAWCHARIRALDEQRIVADLTIQAEDGRPLGDVQGLRLDRVASSQAPCPRLFTIVHRRLGVPEDFRNLDWTAPATQLQRLLQEDERVRGLRILDVAGDAAVPAVSGLDLNQLDGLDLLVTTLGELPANAPGCIHRAASLEALPKRSYDLVFAGHDSHEWSVVQGLNIVIDPAGEGRACAVETAPAHPRFHVLGNVTGWPAGQLTGELAAADCVVDLRESLLEASQTLRQVLEPPSLPALLFVVREGAACPPSPLWGLARAARNEHPGLRVYCIGVPAAQPVAETAALLAAAYREGLDGAPERRWSASGWTVPRLTPLDPPRPVEAATEWRLDLTRPGQLASLRWRAARPALEGLRPGEVRLRVAYVSMHFKDVMLAMGMLRGFKPILGMEASGTVLAIGEQAAAQYPELKPGRPVLCVSMTTDQGAARRSLFGTVAAADARCVFPLPDGVTLEQGAGFLGVYATAWYALTHVGRLRAGETVLIHSAAGGVGQSAIQIAHGLGARVIGSAGSEAKRELLRTGLGVASVLDSHRPERFAGDVMRFTGGRGVDLVLNSLAGEGLRASLRCLRPGGRHVEIGKRDMLEDTPLGLRLLKDNISLHSVHLDLLADSHPEVVRALIAECVARLASGQARPLPVTVFEAADVIDAFRLMAAGKHQSKVLVRIPAGFSPGTQRDGLPATLDPCIPEALFAATETQLITGGTGGLGLALARFMARHGAGRILLASRGGLRTQEQQLHLDGLRNDYPHTQIEVVTLELTGPAALAALLTRESGITGIFHAATSYHAEHSTALDAASLQTWAIKAGTAWRLHTLTRDRRLRHFVLIGSLAGVHGNTGQAAYAAANAALHELVCMRRQQGLPAVAVDLPILLGAGRLSRPAHIRELEFNAGKGFTAVSFAGIEGLLAHVCAAPDACPAVVCVDHPNWMGYLALNRHRAFFEHLVPRSALEGATAEPGTGARQDLDRGQLDREIRSRVAFVLGADLDDIEPETPLIDLGVDSLASRELAAWAQTTYGIAISQTEILTGFSCNAFVRKIVAAGGAALAPAPVAQDVHDGLNGTGADSGRAGADVPESRMAASTATLPESPTDAASRPRPRTAAPLPAPASAADAPHAPAQDASARFETIALHDAPGVASGSVTVTIPSSFGRESLTRLLAQMEGVRQILVLRQREGSEHFCLGMDLDEARFGEAGMSAGLEQFQRLAERLRAAPMPVICVVEGACRGGGMLFPSLATSVLATTGASFGFPEIRQGGLPGLVSVAARARLTEAQCRRYMLTGDRMDAQTAKQLGLADFVGTQAEVERELQRLLHRFSAIDPDLLAAGAALLPAMTEQTALVAMGGLDHRERRRERTPDPLVELQHQPDTGVLVITLNDPTHANAIDWAIANDLHRAIATAKAMGDAVRAVVLQGSGEHFCVGVNPYSFIRRTKDLPVLTAAHVTYGIYRAFVGIRGLGVPVICVLHGKVMGGGLAAMLNADYRIAAQSTVFNYGNLPRGVCPGMLLSENLERVVGARWAMDLYLQDYTLTAT
ncbi:MAG TPA: beta-ketoacyl synthase N-terminal-like domain-containing protein, partial [Candidatus Competibacter sp.]|nr:beta-ketoacyl synthase N-terminal-like domain-containing protein [Candidatus Competibacter sp.]